MGDIPADSGGADSGGIVADADAAEETQGLVDVDALNGVAGQAVGLYAAIQEAAIGFEIATAGAKLARDKAKAVTG